MIVSDDDQINCDICEEGRELLAVKTCVTCLASFCSVHLTSHEKSQVLSKHCLCAPVGNIKDLLCKKHNKVLELFCMIHRAAICWQCTAKHRNCKTCSVEEMRNDWKAAIDPVEIEVESREYATDEALETLETLSEGIKDAAGKMMEDVRDCYETLKNTIEQAQNRVIAFIEKERVEALQQIDNQKERLDNHKVTLSNIKEKIAECRSNDSYFNFCLILPVLPPEVGQLEDVQMDGHSVEIMIQDLQHLNSSLESQLSAMFQRREELRDKYLESDDFRVVSGHSKRRRYLLKYSSKVTFDPVSASASLLFSEDGLAVTVDHSGLFTWKDYQVNPDLGFRVLCSQEFTMGKHYWEVLPPKDMNCNWAVGVTYKNGQALYQSLGQDKSSWCVIWHNKEKDKVKDEISNELKDVSVVTQAKEGAAELEDQKLETETSQEESHLKISREQKLGHQEKGNQTQMSETMPAKKGEDENVADEEKMKENLEEKEKEITVKTSTGFFASHNEEMHLISQELPKKIGVLLDCDQGWLFFFLASDSKVKLCYKFQALFSAPLCPAIWLREPEKTMRINL
ncbi:tripartite motif-containing protein 16-like [Trichomycterus rosablanca]|uniref:tripartite motif-containing protein 16-like n=1 Tax=Trichomycterus rosablanca TaxID=2290929 RepID=UPI002F3554D1